MGMMGEEGGGGGGLGVSASGMPERPSGQIGERWTHVEGCDVVAHFDDIGTWRYCARCKSRGQGKRAGGSSFKNKQPPRL